MSTSTSPLKSARLEFRVTADQKEVIEEAAAIEGRTVTDFSASVLVERAQEVIERERRLRVDAVRLDASSRSWSVRPAPSRVCES